jgi:hypothetical protein
MKNPAAFNFAMQVYIYRPFASLIRDAKDSKIIMFSIAIERMAMEKYSAAYGAKTI